MRKIFFELLHREMNKNEIFFMLTADMGYGLLDQIRKDYPTRFLNIGSAEQLTIGIAAGMTM